MRNLHAVLLTSLCFAALSCRSSFDKPFRTAVAPNDVVNTSIASLEETKSSGAAVKAAEATVELHHDPKVVDGDFQLAFVEFGDDGTAWSAAQRQRVIKTVTDAGEPNGIALLVFVHGWRHNANVCDDNVACFRQVLQSFAIREHTLNGAHPRSVVGVYLGWRGLSSCTEPLTTTSIWRRKNIGENLGARAGREVLRQLMTAFGSVKDGHPNSRLIIAGHSLGAGVVFSAVTPLLLQRLHDAIPQDAQNRTIKRIDTLDVTPESPTQTPPVPLPDLVLLLNPAFEAELYKPIQLQLSSMAARNIQFDSCQQPLMMTISSSHDGATKGIFFLGQFLEAVVTPLWWFHGPAYLVRQMVTPPHLPSYITHRAIAPSAMLPNRDSSPSGDSCFSYQDVRTMAERQVACGCSEMTATDFEKLKKQTAAYALEAQTKKCDRKDDERYGPVRLQRIRGDRSNPFLVVTADGLIRNHDDIYNTTLLAFVTNVITQIELAKPK